MYNKGQGVAQDYKEAIRWFRMSVRNGNEGAAHLLGAAFGLGEGVKVDMIRAHMWYNIAAIGGNSLSLEMRNTIASKMTPQQIEQAQRMARECMASNFKKCD